jgi:hypothetical protein
VTDPAVERHKLSILQLSQSQQEGIVYLLIPMAPGQDFSEFLRMQSRIRKERVAALGYPQRGLGVRVTGLKQRITCEVKRPLWSLIGPSGWCFSLPSRPVRR